jgi:hypothetical protein
VTFQIAKGPASVGALPDHGSNNPHKDIENVDTDITIERSGAMQDSGAVIVTVNPRDRLQLATTIENLINLLDDMDGDPDLEPYLAGLHMGGHTDDREGDDGYGQDADREPSLGWTANGDLGKEMPPMFGPDLEADDIDDEPGTWIEQATCREYDTVADENLEEQHDREEDPAERGIADDDAMHSEDLCFAGLRFDGEGQREADALLATHEALRFSCGADAPVVHSVQVSA